MSDKLGCSRLKMSCKGTQQLFLEEVGLTKNIVVSIHVDQQTTPRFYRPCLVPYAIKSKIEKELQCLENKGVVSKVDRSEWVAPIVPVMKPDGTVRICSDYKVTINQAIKLPLPRTEDILASMAGGQRFLNLT